MDTDVGMKGDISCLMKVQRADGAVTYFQVAEGETREISEQAYIDGGGE